MKPANILIGLAALCLVEAGTYLYNPFHMATSDPFARLWGFKTYHQPAQSMAPTIQAGDFLVVSAWPYMRSEPKAGDVIAFRYPVDPSVEYVKRVIAIGGSTIAIVDGVVLVDDWPLHEPYVRASSARNYYSRGMKAVRVPLNCYFVMGDNRDASPDSRSWGCVPRANVIGKLVR